MVILKFILLVLLTLGNVYASSELATIKTLSTLEKKQRFLNLLVPVIKKVHKELLDKYIKISKNIQESKETYEIKNLIKKYKVKNEHELLLALKPHPKSITIAQAAIESAWATSRFFNEANNVFGMWSSNKNEKRIQALKKRNNHTVWLKKFDSIEDSVRAYYKLLALGKSYKEFRELRMQTENVYLLSEKLNNYCELGSEYCIRIESLIRYNKFEKYD